MAKNGSNHEQNVKLYNSWFCGLQVALKVPDLYDKMSNTTSDNTVAHKQIIINSLGIFLCSFPSNKYATLPPTKVYN